MSDDRVDGVLLKREGGVFFVPADRLSEFRLADDAAERVIASTPSDDVTGFAQNLRSGVKPLSWGFEGKIFNPINKSYSTDPTAS